MSRFQLLSDAQWSLIAPFLPSSVGKPGRPFSDARTMVEGIIYRYRTGIAWRFAARVRPMADGLEVASEDGRRRHLGSGVVVANGAS
mgnify:CR=1 FL=1